MEMKKDDLHELGYFSKLHGYKGELTAVLHTANQSDYEGLKLIIVKKNNTLTPYVVHRLEYKTNTTTKVKLEGIESEAQAKALVGSTICIEPKYLSDADNEKLTMRALAGFKVSDERLGLIGTVSHIEENPVNPLMVITAGKKEILLPMHADFFQKIDRRSKTVHIAAPEGLIEFYMQ
ncbi:MAG: ribosome maturation factor RimM [Flavobacteriales bacterium]